MGSVISKLNSFGNSFKAFEPNAVRMMLGVIIFTMGIYFQRNIDLLIHLIDPVSVATAKLFLAHYVIMAHIAGGTFIAMGLLTRIACLIQIPILVGAIIANISIGDKTSLVYSVIVLLFLCFYAVIGSSRISVDYKFQLHV